MHLSARDAAGDLKAHLAAVGVLARRLNIYETVERELSPDQVDEIALADAVLLHSPRAARRLSEAYGRSIGPQCGVICLSPAIAAALTGIAPRPVLIAKAPNETALLTSLTAQLTKA
jgi:uroporphyrinogen-III synthase